MSGEPAAALQRKVNDYWTGRADAYDSYQQRPDRLALDQQAWGDIWSAALPQPPARVLDLGTGSGYVALLLAHLGFQVTATDLSEGMLRRAREHAARVAGPPEFLVGDAVAPDFPEASFDVITNRYLIWTLREPERALTRWLRLLRPGGVLAAVDSTWFPHGLEVGADEAFVTSYDEQVRAALPLAAAPSIEPVRELIESAGFGEVTVTPLTTILALDREHGVAPNHEPRLQYLVRGMRLAE